MCYYTQVCTYNLDASIDMLVLIVEVQRVLSVVFRTAHALGLALWVIEVFGLEILIILLLIVWHITTSRCTDKTCRLHSTLK